MIRADDDSVANSQPQNLYCNRKEKKEKNIFN